MRLLPSTKLWFFIADGEDRVEVEVLNLVGLSVGGSCCTKCNSCLAIELPLPEDIPQMPGNDRLVALEQGGYLVEAQPNGVLLQAHIQTRSLCLLVDDDLAPSAARHFQFCI